MGLVLEGSAIGYGLGRLIGDIQGPLLFRHELERTVFDQDAYWNPDILEQASERVTKWGGAMGGVTGGAAGGYMAMVEERKVV